MPRTASFAVSASEERKRLLQVQLVQVKVVSEHGLLTFSFGLLAFSFGLLAFSFGLAFGLSLQSDSAILLWQAGLSVRATSVKPEACDRVGPGPASEASKQETGKPHCLRRTKGMCHDCARGTNFT